MKNQVRNWKENNVFAFVAASSSPVTVIASSILVQCHSISQHGQLSFMNQHQTHRLCARIHTAVELPLAASLLKQQQQSAAAVKEAGLSPYVDNEKENIEDEKKDRVLLAQLVEATKGTSSFIFILI